MPGIRLVDVDDIHDGTVEGSQVFLFMLRAPLLFDRSHVIKSLGSFGFVGSGCVHRRERADACIGRRLQNGGPYFGGNGNDPLVNQKLAGCFNGPFH